jgi:xanthine dehydrogenase small subunit
MPTPPLRFVRRAHSRSLHGVAPERTLLQVLREDLHCTGPRRAAMKAIAAPARWCWVSPRPMASASATARSTACIRLAHSIDGMALWTAQDLLTNGTLHPVQQAMVQCHASQCGFCTPGFVMSLFGLYQNHTVARRGHHARTGASQALSGNLCRCTGYRPHSGRHPAAMQTWPGAERG